MFLNSLDDACRKFYDKYINMIYDMMVKNTDPDRVCPSLKLCSDDSYVSENDDWLPAIDPTQTNELEENPVCKECQSAVDYLVETMKNKKVVDFLLKELVIKVCNPLTFIERKACTK